jgi:flagellar hook-basal body complex protein FliE
MIGFIGLKELRMNDIRIGTPVMALPLSAGEATTRPTEGFSAALQRAIGEVNQLQQAADGAAAAVVRGETGIHEGMLAMGKADLSLRLMLQVRNKAMDAYREIMQMSV